MAAFFSYGYFNIKLIYTNLYIYKIVYIFVFKFIEASMSKMNIKTGTPVEGEDFFGRVAELEYIWGRIKAGNNFIIPSPRRIGKTSFALKLVQAAKKEGWDIVHLNLEKNKNEQAFVEELIDALKNNSTWEKIKDKGNNILDKVKKLKPSVEMEGVTVSLEWNNIRDNIYKQLENLLNHDESTLIFMDELTVLLTNILNQENGLEHTSNFMHWMRSLRIKPDSKIRWVFCSSIGIDNFTYSHNLSGTINELTEYELKSFDKFTAKAMLTKLSMDNDVFLKEELKEAILEKIGHSIPFFIQLMVESIKYLQDVEKQVLDTKIVQKAYDLLTNSNNFNTWIERINLQYGENKKYAFQLLKYVCQENLGVKRESLLNAIVSLDQDISQSELILSTVIYMLKNDGYLVVNDGFYSFRSPLIRDFWKIRFVQ